MTANLCLMCCKHVAECFMDLIKQPDVTAMSLHAVTVLTIDITACEGSPACLPVTI